jgi:hypothetical protein
VIRSGICHGPQAAADVVEAPVRQQQRIAAGHDDVANLGVLLEVTERRLELRHRNLLGVAHLAPPRAEAAVRRAHRRHEKQRAIGIAVRDVGDRAVRVFVEAVHEPVADLQLLQRRDVLRPDRIARSLDQVDHGGRDAELEVLHRLAQPVHVLDMFRPEALGKLVERADAFPAKPFLPGLHQVRSLV